jgi:hypothetical protein
MPNYSFALEIALTLALVLVDDSLLLRQLSEQATHRRVRELQTQLGPTQPLA